MIINQKGLQNGKERFMLYASKEPCKIRIWLYIVKGEICLIFLGILGFLGFIIFIIVGVLSLIKRNGKAKRNFIIALIMLFLFVGAVTSSPEETTDNTKEVKVEAKHKETKVKEEKRLTLVTLKSKIKEGMTFPKEYDEMKKTLDVPSEENISIGNGNVGRALKADDGYLVVTANTTQNKITEVNTFKTIEEVQAYEEEMVAKAKRKKDYFDNKIVELKENSKGVILDIRENPYSPEDSHMQWQVIVSDAWYNSQEHEKERFVETMGNTVEGIVRQVGYVNGTSNVIVNFLDSYGKVLAEERVVLGGYKIKE